MRRHSRSRFFEYRLLVARRVTDCEQVTIGNRDIDACGSRCLVASAAYSSYANRPPLPCMRRRRRRRGRYGYPPVSCRIREHDLFRLWSAAKAITNATVRTAADVHLNVRSSACLSNLLGRHGRHNGPSPVVWPIVAVSRSRR